MMLNLEFSDFFDQMPEQGSDIVVFFSETEELKYGIFKKYATEENKFHYVLVVTNSEELKIGPFDFWSTVEEYEEEVTNAHESINIYHKKDKK